VRAGRENGFSADDWLVAQRDSILVQMGRFAEAERELERALALARDDEEPDCP
jgi:predicted RNA polymerase sigma factor